MSSMEREIKFVVDPGRVNAVRAALESACRPDPKHSDSMVDGKHTPLPFRGLYPRGWRIELAAPDDGPRRLQRIGDDAAPLPAHLNVSTATRVRIELVPES
jgi:hypothetical protein